MRVISGRLTSSTGGRTAWSYTVDVEDWNVPARFWYDGANISNAREDAAEVMLTRLKSPNVYGRPRRGGTVSNRNHSAFGQR
jgi:hypothetical protein